MKLSELLSAVPGVDVDVAGDAELTLITDDSRKVGPGALFVAIRGTRMDGHEFVTAACESGASAIVCESPEIAAQVRSTRATIPVVRVNDAASWLARASSAWHGLLPTQVGPEFPIVAVTGTNGKTTVSRMVQALLDHNGQRSALIGTVCYDLIDRQIPAPMTTPPALELASMLSDARRAGAVAASMEVSSHSLSQRRTDGLAFRVGVFTNLTGDHLDYHQNMEAYLAAKKRLFDGLASDALAVVNGEDAASDAMVADCRAGVIRYGLAETFELCGEIESMSVAGCRVQVRYRGEAAVLESVMIGRHNVMNALAAVGAGLGMGLSLEAACDGVGQLTHVRGRLEPVDTRGLGFTVTVDYAHTDDALRNVLTALRPLTTGRLWCIFGCGGDRDRTKRPRMARAAAELSDQIVVTSDNPRSEEPQAIIAEIRSGFAAEELSRTHFEADRAAAIHHAVAHATDGDTVLIAGKGHEDYQLIGTRRLRFDDVEVASAAIAHRIALR